MISPRPIENHDLEVASLRFFSSVNDSEATEIQIVLDSEVLCLVYTMRHAKVPAQSHRDERVSQSGRVIALGKVLMISMHTSWDMHPPPQAHYAY